MVATASRSCPFCHPRVRNARNPTLGTFMHTHADQVREICDVNFVMVVRKHPLVVSSWDIKVKIFFRQ